MRCFSRKTAGSRKQSARENHGAKFEAIGRVAYASADANMGIAFVRIEPNEQTILEKWISELRDRK